MIGIVVAAGVLLLGLGVALLGALTVSITHVGEGMRNWEKCNGNVNRKERREHEKL